MVIVFCCSKDIAVVRILFTQLKFIFLICSFYLEAKETKVQDLETPAKNFKNFLKSPNLYLAYSNARSNSGYSFKFLWAYTSYHQGMERYQLSVS